MRKIIQSRRLRAWVLNLYVVAIALIGFSHSPLAVADKALAASPQNQLQIGLQSGVEKQAQYVIIGLVFKICKSGTQLPEQGGSHSSHTFCAACTLVSACGLDKLPSDQSHVIRSNFEYIKHLNPTTHVVETIHAAMPARGPPSGVVC